MDNFPRNASDLESRGTVSGWSVHKTQSTQSSDVWQACRYYEVGDIQDDIWKVISNATFGEELSPTSLSTHRVLARTQALGTVAM